MRKITIIAFSVLALIVVINALFFKNLYSNQIEYIIKQLDRESRIAGSDIDNTSMYFFSDLTKIDFSDDISMFFSDNEVKRRSIEKLKLYYSKYEDLIINFKLYDNNGNVYTLFKDEDKNAWIDGFYDAQVQPEIITHEKIESVRENFNYYLPLIQDNVVIGNFVITVNLDRYFSRLFSKYDLGEAQWQWVVNDSSSVIFDNHTGSPGYTDLRKVSTQAVDGVAGRLIHSMIVDNEKNEIISSYYPFSLMGQDYGLVFSAPTDFFQKYIIRNSAIITIVNLLLVLLIISLYRIFGRKQARQMLKTRDTESTLVKVIEDMPLGIVVYNQNGEILKANHNAASLFSYQDEHEMLGKLMPDISRKEYKSEFIHQFGEGEIIKTNSSYGERIVFRSTIPISYAGEAANLESFIDITSLESARKQEAEENIAKSELLARMSFEIRTPLNGIIGMTEMLGRADLPPATREIAALLRRSTDLLLNIINDIFDVSKVETGKMILDEIPFKVREEIKYCIDLIMRDNPDSMVNLVYEVDPLVPDNVIGDPYRLRQIITNLLSNSLTTNIDGDVSLKCKLKESEKSIITLEFTLTDTGKCLTKAEIKKLFGDYITNKSMRSEWNEELRLGPVLSRQLVELMDGELNADSPAFIENGKKGKGLKINFTIKVHLNERIFKNINVSGYSELSELRTLVVAGGQSRDDDFLTILHKLKVPVSVTSFQKHTIPQIASNKAGSKDKYVLIILFDDEETDGFVAAEALRDAGLTNEYIILMFTSRDPKGHYPRCVDLGIDHLLVKPFSSSELANVIMQQFPNLKFNSGSGGANVPSVLVVDDNALNRKVVGSLLKVLGIIADYAEDGQDAISRVKKKNYDIVFMDLIMPVLDGFESAKKILEFDKAITIVALSADNMPETKLKAEQAGMKELVAKPVSVDDLRNVIEKYKVRD